MPFSHYPEAQAVDKPLAELPVMGGRYVLRRCMAETALGKVYWAYDQHNATDDATCNALVFTILPALARDDLFEQALCQVLPAYQQGNTLQPTVLAEGKEADGTRWLVLQNIWGMLLSERLQELDDRGMPLNEAFEILYGISHALSALPWQTGFGFLEPGAILGDARDYCLLNAPVVAALHLANNDISRTPPKHRMFHSRFISPEVALGDQADSRDDTFSLACIAYYLFKGQAPFGEQTTLEAAARSTFPSAINKLKPEIWTALRQGMSSKREQRQASPALLLQALQQRKHSRFVLPVAAFGVVSLLAYAGYRIFNDNKPAPTVVSAEATLPAGSVTPVTPTTETTPPSQPPELVNEPSLPPVVDQETAEKAAKAQEDADRLIAMQREVQAKIASELAAATGTNTARTTEQQQQIDAWLAQAQTAIHQGNLLSYDTAKPAAADYLTQVLQFDPENDTAKKLALQMVDDLHREAENLLQAQRYDAANNVLLDSDKLITKFNLTDSLQHQAQLEARADQNIQETHQIKQYLQSAERAIRYNNIMQGDERSESAIGYLNALFEAYPNHPEGMKLLKRIIRQQHEQANRALQRYNHDEARRYLDDSQTLIGRYTLDDMVESQLALEKRYRDKQLEGIFPSTQPAPIANNAKPAQPATNTTQPEPAEKRRNNTGNPSTAQPAPVVIAPTADTVPSAAPTAIPEEQPPATPESVPIIEVPVSPDLPIATMPDATETVEIPPVLLDAPQADSPIEPTSQPFEPTVPIDSELGAVTPSPEHAPLENPTETGNNDSSSFAPDIQGVDELPIPDELTLPVQ